MKHLEVEQNERINATYKSRVRADEEPMFYGTRRLDVSAFSNGDEIASAILSKLAQTIERSSARPITSSRSTRIGRPINSAGGRSIASPCST